MFVDPVAFQLGPLAVHWYGIIIATGVLAGAVLGTIEARRRGEDPEVGWSMLMLVLVFAVVAARLYHVIHQWGFYSQPQNLILIPQVWRGGLGIPGAVVGGALAIWLYTRATGAPTARWLDIFAPPLLLGQAIGRLGNFVNQELYGPPTDLPWGIPIDAAHRAGTPWDPISYPVDTTRFHPLFAYEALLNLVGLVLILWIARRYARRLYDGDVLLMYIMWYGVVRSSLEWFRTGNWVILGVPTAVWLGVLGFVLAGGFLILRHRRGWGRPAPWMDRDSQTDAAATPSSGDAASTTEPQPG